MSLHLAGYSFTCAAGDEHDFRPGQPPATRPSNILGDRLTLPYYQAFAPTLLTLDALLPLLEAHVHRAIASAGWQTDDLAHIPVFLGSTVYILADREAHGLAALEHPHYTLSDIARALSARLNHVPVFSLATSCTSAAHGIAQAQHILANGLASRALVIGFESFNRTTFEHFRALNLLADAPGAPGIILGEAIACLALSRDPRHSRARIHALASHNDSASLTDSSAAALNTLLDAVLAQAPRAPQTIKKHASGANSDAMENAVLADRLPHIATYAWKPHTGHTLGASAALETALTLHQPPARGSHLHYYLGFGGSHIAWLLEL